VGTRVGQLTGSTNPYAQWINLLLKRIILSFDDIEQGQTGWGLMANPPLVYQAKASGLNKNRIVPRRGGEMGRRGAVGGKSFVFPVEQDERVNVTQTCVARPYQRRKEYSC